MLPAIAVFAKAPLPGRVKTRLAAALGEWEAARQSERMTATLLERLLASQAWDVELHTDIPSDAWNRFSVTTRLQAAGDLGARMLHALQAGLAAGRERMLIVGGDVPTVPLDYLSELLAADADVCLGPAEDGGYYAICCRRTDAAMFDGVAWSTARACEMTAAACRRAGLSVYLGREWFDIDEPLDLARI